MKRRPAAAAPSMWLVCGCVAGLVACSTTPRTQAVEPAGGVPAASTAISANEEATLAAWLLQQRLRAQQAQAAGQHAAALQAWAAVLALAPEDGPARAGLEQAHAATQRAAQQHAQRAEQARVRGETEAAMRGHLEALALDPGLHTSAQALRELENLRARRLSPTRFARAPLPPPAPELAPELSPALAPPRDIAAASALDEADLLQAHGEPEAALQLLEPMAREPRADGTLKQRVCELLLRPGQAVTLERVRRCLRLLPKFAPALQAEQALRGAAR